MKEWIQAFGGGKVHPLAPNPAEFDIRDIARSISMLCRYNGHVDRFYSVAEHSCHVAWIIEQRGGTLHQVRWALLHDASEAYLADVPSPVKHMPAMEPYRLAEANLQAAIADRFGLVGGEPSVVHQVDHEIRGIEARQLKSPVHPEWGLTLAGGELPPDPPELRGITLGLSPAASERRFLSLFEDLFGEIS
jgi:hypothetical protein